MGFFNNLKCKIGLHDWSELSKKEKGSCTQTCICENCKKEDTSINHEWNEAEYLKSN